jgi:histidyl-tRNA synthetase
MNDVLPAEIGRWQRLERAFREAFELGGYREVRTPLVEPTALFVRSIGEATDVVEKEMYTFARHDESLTLRPEGTAGAARAYLEHGVNGREPTSRWYYLGPMFRAERPQRGRYRQFYQAGAEVYGDSGPATDAEMIDMLVGLMRSLGIADVTVLVNSLGSSGTRARYRDALIAHLAPKKDTLSEDSQRRLEKNPLRILDSKAKADQEACADAPTLLDVLDDDDRAHWDALRRHLDALGTPYVVDPRLVRGLDYYTRTLFELRGAGGELGAQNALGGGGRYDDMLHELGGPKVPCIGFALGLERLLLAMGETKDETPSRLAYVAPLSEPSMSPCLVVARDLRALGVEAQVAPRPRKLKDMLAQASGKRARFAVIVGDGELERGVAAVKDLEARTQKDVPLGDVAREIAAILGVAR